MARVAKKDQKGRPTKYTKKLAEEFCAHVAQGEPIRQVCLLENMPHEATIYRWLIKHEEFCDKYARAKEIQADKFSEELIDIADDGTNDWEERENERTGQTYVVLNKESVSRSKLRVETRKWLMSKFKPKKYGDKLHNVHTGEDGKPIESNQRIIFIDKEEKAGYEKHIKEVINGD